MCHPIKEQEPSYQFYVREFTLGKLIMFYRQEEVYIIHHHHADNNKRKE